MFNKKTFTILLGLMSFVLIGSAFTHVGLEKPKRNLKVLPKNISPQDLDSTMESFKKALGVDCNFCHVQSKKDPKELDFASDEKGEKQIARKMYTMTKKINKKYFHYNKNADIKMTQAVVCNTCHRGEPHPELEQEEEE